MSERSDHLPLTALRAFEAAARHLSFQNAAAELGVTPAALSFQIRQLEEALGQALFERSHRAVHLNEAGLRLLPGVREGMDSLRAAWRAAHRHCTDRIVNITAGPAFTSKWLAPRLFLFAAEHPEIELRFTATLRLLDLRRDDVDLALRFGPDRHEGLSSGQLLREWLTPMMTPALAARFTSPESLREAPLLHHDERAFMRRPADWAGWFRAAGLGPPPSGGAQFSQADHALDAAISGAGVVLGRATLAQDALEAGRLVAPFSLSLVPEESYRFLCAPGAEARAPVRAFLDWLMAEAARISAQEAGRDFRSDW
ncbi:transcriptional regulator GcvA [Pseudothioclava nitratireducens]|uniref:transcriptional regulator GcvA n=1 Tax=Pseudothioclava nitratireducens TaxID=1928646 RepID=UPI0023DA1E32|nr:transcriptional regulator GcvA [Defluviimonas nitratireducens]MDF1620869.1 transcriptional regulator GcvA [Defluviimonas nitratireducens]